MQKSADKLTELIYFIVINKNKFSILNLVTSWNKKFESKKWVHQLTIYGNPLSQKRMVSINVFYKWFQ